MGGEVFIVLVSCTGAVAAASSSSVSESPKSLSGNEALSRAGHQGRLTATFFKQDYDMKVIL
jgi:hypothetical protein